jgi:thiol:disulfide interchange protein DsbD
MKCAQALILSAALLLIGGPALAKPWWLRGVETNDTDFLPPDAAFRVGARVDGQAVKVRWAIADGYYLYRSKITVAAESPDLVVLGIALPHGTVKTDPYLGTNEVFTQQVEGLVPYRQLDYGAHPLQIKVTYQGCAEAGLCYPLITKVLFPTTASQTGMAPSPPRFQAFAIIGGAAAFLLAGLVLRKGRRLELPTT